MAEEGDGGNWLKWVIGVVLVPIAVAAIAAGWFHFGQSPQTGSPPATPVDVSQSSYTPAEVTLSRATAPRGATVTVYGSGFQPGESVEIRVHVTVVGSSTANSQGIFKQNIVIPESAPPPGFPTSISATGHSSIKSASAPFSTA
jgi:hypothetical protein